MIVWRGTGILVAVIIFVSSLCANALAIQFGGKGYWETHGWPFACAMIAAGGLIHIVDYILGKKPPRELIDADTGEHVHLNAPRDFFFIPMKWWGPITAVFGLVFLAAGWKPGA